MLNSRVSVPLPKTGVIIRRSGKYQYVFKVLSTFRNDKGQPSNTRVSIGRLDADGTRLIPNNNYYDYYAPVDEPAPYGIEERDVVSVGAAFIVEHILTELGLVQFLTDVLGSARAMSVVIAATYMVCEGNVFEYVSDWCENSLVGRNPLTPQKASALFASLTRDERMAFFQKWVGRHGLSGYLSYDVTSFSSYAEGVRDLEWGYNRDGDRLPQINLGCYLAQENGLPMFYVTYPGSIVDKTYLPYMLVYNEELGINDAITFVMDRGFCSTNNINHMHEESLSYIIGTDTRTKATLAAINEVRDNLLSLRNLVRDGVYASSVRSRFFGERATMHIYHSPDLGEQQRRDLLRLVVNMENELAQLMVLSDKELTRYSRFLNIEQAPSGLIYSRNYDKIDEASHNCGIFCILSNTNLSSEKVLEIYRRKDTIEKGFDEIKNHIDMKRLRVHSESAIEGKLFCAFIALIAVAIMTNQLHVYNDMSGHRSMSKRKLIAELEKIRICETAGTLRLLHPLTKTQRDLLDLFNADLDDMHRYIIRSEE